ncbi:MAG: 2Fe-2S iron-sulfur cluster-binding protein [Mariprofundales bacterium]|nr:2Fe-2S iron-sulfur cluster-binding protein [Mariprofundales bacterium]
MPTITFLPSGRVVEVEKGAILLQAANSNGVNIPSSCGGNLACTSCHVLIKRGGWWLSGPDNDEGDLLDSVTNVQPQSRLACQVRVTRSITVVIPD